MTDQPNGGQTAASARPVTPLTDIEATQHGLFIVNVNTLQEQMVRADFARRLERENTDMRDALKRIVFFDSNDYSMHIRSVREIAIRVLSKQGAI